MDKSSPVYENFAKKMDAMSGKPKINRQSIKLGGGMGLETRVGNNEKKITILKNIFKTQREQISEKITPKVSNLELSLNETTEILTTITDKLSLDMSERLKEQKALFDAQRKQNLTDKKDKAEENLEKKKKITVGKKIGKAIAKPFVGIFDQLKELALILGTGILGTNFIRKLSDGDFTTKLTNIFDWTVKNWKAIAIGAGVIGTIFVAGAIANFIGGASLAFAVLTNPVLLGIIGTILAVKAVNDLMLKQDTGNKMIENAEKSGKKLSEKNKQRIKEIGDKYDTTKLGLNITPGSLQAGPVQEQLMFAELFLNSLSNVFGADKVKLEEVLKDVPNNLVEFQKKSIELRNLNKENNGGRTTFVNLDDIDATTDRNKLIAEMNNNPATAVPDIESINPYNPYMEEVPELFGFADVIYS